MFIPVLYVRLIGIAMKTFTSLPAYCTYNIANFLWGNYVCLMSCILGSWATKL